MEKKKGGTCFSTHRLRRNGKQLNHYSVPNSQYSFTKKKKQKQWKCLLDYKENLNYCDCTIHIGCPGSLLKIISKGGLEKNTLTTLAHRGSAEKRPSNGYLSLPCRLKCWQCPSRLPLPSRISEGSSQGHTLCWFISKLQAILWTIHQGQEMAIFLYIILFRTFSHLWFSNCVCMCVCVCARVHAHAPTHLSLPFRLNSNINLWCNIFAPHQNGKDELQRSNWVERIKKMTSLQTWTCQKRILLSAPLCGQPGTLNSPWPAACCPCFISFDHHLFYVTVHNIPREYMCVLHLCTF